MAKSPGGKKAGKHRPGGKPQQRGAAPAPPAGLSPEAQQALDGILTVVREDPGGWAAAAEALKSRPEVDHDSLLEFVARSLGREALPLLRGLALEQDEEPARSALRALPLLGTRAAGDALAEAYAAHPEGERAKLAWEGVQALQARGINVTVPEPGGVRKLVPEYTLREMWESYADGVGSGQAFARVQDRYGVWYSVAVAWNEQAGVKEGFLMPMSRREFERVCEHVEASDVQMVRVPEDFSRWQVEQARAINEQSGFPLEDHLEAWDRVIGPPSEGYQPPDPLELVKDLSPDERCRRAEDGDALEDLPTIHTWAFEPADVRPWYDRFIALEDEDLPDEEADAAEDAILSEAVRELLKPEMKDRFRNRVLDVARKLHLAGEKHKAELAACIVAEIDSGRDPAEMEFFRSLAFTGLEMLGEMLVAGEDPEELRYDPMRPVDELPD